MLRNSKESAASTVISRNDPFKNELNNNNSSSSSEINGLISNLSRPSMTIKSLANENNSCTSSSSSSTASKTSPSLSSISKTTGTIEVGSSTAPFSRKSNNAMILTRNSPHYVPFSSAPTTTTTTNGDSNSVNGTSALVNMGGHYDPTTRKYVPTKQPFNYNNSNNGFSKSYNRGGGNNAASDGEFALLQRPTILSKPTLQQQDSVVTLVKVPRAIKEDQQRQENSPSLSVNAHAPRTKEAATTSATASTRLAANPIAADLRASSKLNGMVLNKLANNSNSNSSSSSNNNNSLVSVTSLAANLSETSGRLSTAALSNSSANSKSLEAFSTVAQLGGLRDTQTPTKETTAAASSGVSVKQQQQQLQFQSDLSAVSSSLSSTSFMTSFAESLTARFNTPPFMSQSVKLLDENLQWSDSLLEFLCDQNEYTVVGVLGKKGVGKSTIMSLLAGSSSSDSSRDFIFKAADKDTRALGQHKTSGVGAFVTSERTILLDVQPLLCGSVLERLLSGEPHVNHKKFAGGPGNSNSNNSSAGSNIVSNSSSSSSSNEYKYYETHAEIQSIELACFILAICNVVLVAEDWFVDPNLFRLLQTAEMLMPSLSVATFSNSGASSSGVSMPNNALNNSSSSSSSAMNSGAGGGNSAASQTLAHQADEHYFQSSPHLVYVLNKSDFISRADSSRMKQCIDKLMRDSKLVYKSVVANKNGHHSSIGNNSGVKKQRNAPRGSTTPLTRDSGSAASRDTPTPESAVDISSSVNFFVMPRIEEDPRRVQSTGSVNEFKGLPSVDRSVNKLLHELVSLRRNATAAWSTASSTATATSVGGQNVFTEKRWFAYASRMWESIRKSQLIAEYNRLMT